MCDYAWIGEGEIVDDGDEWRRMEGSYPKCRIYDIAPISYLVQPILFIPYIHILDNIMWGLHVRSYESLEIIKAMTTTIWNV